MDIDLLQRSVDRLHDTFDNASLDMERRKVEQKLEEARLSPGDVRPLADCIYSLLLAARSAGFRVETVLGALEKVAGDNLTRKWRKMPDGTYHAI